MVKNEGTKHKNAFEFYYALSNNRSLEKVAEEFDVSKTAVGNWSRMFKWINRVRERDTEVFAKVKEEVILTAAEEKKRMMLIVDGTMRKFVEKLNSGKIVVSSVRDLDLLVKNRLLLMGEATEKTETLSLLAQIAKEDGATFGGWNQEQK